MPTSSLPVLSRRRFLRHAAVVGGAVVVPTVIPSRVIGAAGRPGANGRFVVAHIGVGAWASRTWRTC
ncbi:MAG: twin-arginine translocation signal domain-containing protein [Verrucomicrobia bacterium]|nr:twin-arginine translocation signal domain-containing protein [Verrucomicrobiota bacterium]